jgi:hypothetical protein
MYSAPPTATSPLAGSPITSAEASRATTGQTGDSPRFATLSGSHRTTGSGDASASGQIRRAGDDGELGKVLERLDRYREDLLARERWIRIDLVRRGLLPEYPIWGHR